MSDIWKTVSVWVQQTLQISPPMLTNILWTLVAIAVWLLARRITHFVVTRRVTEIARQYVIRKTTDYLLGLVGILVLVRIWIGGIGGLAAYFGILSAGLAIALQDPLTNLAGWLFIAIRKPFVVGDRVQIGDQAGDVIDLRLFQFSLVEIGNWVAADQSTGRIIHVPNNSVFKETIANYTQGFNFIWNEIAVVVTFESNWKKAKDLLQEIAAEHSAVKSEHAAQQVRKAARKFLIFFQHLTPIVWTSVEGNGVKLTIRYLSEPRKRRSSEATIWEAVLTAFSEEDDIDFAYPTTRFYQNTAEGKKGLRPTSGS